MFSRLRAGQLNAGGDRTQQDQDALQDGCRPNTVHQEAVSSSVTGEQFLQWQQRVTSTRQGKEGKMRQDKMMIETCGSRITQVKMDNEQLAGKEEQLANEFKVEEGLLTDTEAQLGFLEGQLQEVGGLERMVKEMQEQEKLAKVEQDSSLRDMEERFRLVQLTEMAVKIKLDEGISSLRVSAEANVVKVREGLEATKKQHLALAESKTMQSHRKRDLAADVEAGAKTNMELEEGMRVNTQAVVEGKSHLETKSLEIYKNKSLLEALANKEADNADDAERKVTTLKEEKKLAKERLSQVQECVGQLRQEAMAREFGTEALEKQVRDQEAGKTGLGQKMKQLQGEVEQLTNMRKKMEVTLGRKDAAEKQLGILKQIQQEKFGEEERGVVLQGEVQVTSEQAKLKKDKLKALQDQVVSEQANLQGLTTKSGLSEQRMLDLEAKNGGLDALVMQNKDELRAAEKAVLDMEEKLEACKAANKEVKELVDTLDKEVSDTLKENERLEQQLVSAEAEEAGERQMLTSTKSEEEDCVEAVEKMGEEAERLKRTVHPKEEELTSKKERSNSLAMGLHQLSDERRSVEENLAASSGSLNKVEHFVQQLNSKTEELKILEAKVGGQLADALSTLEQGEKKQELRGEHAENLKKVKKLQKAVKQAKSEMTMVVKRKEKLERQCVKTQLEKSKVKNEFDQVAVDVKTARDGIVALSTAAAADEKTLSSGKEEFERCKTEAEQQASQSQVLGSETKELKEKIKKAEGILRKESSKVEEQNMMLEEKQRKGNAAESATEAECRVLEQTLNTARAYLEQSQSQKKQLMDNLDKEEKESRSLKEKFEEVEKSISSASRKTPQQLRRSGSDKNRQTPAPRSTLTPLPVLKKKEAESGKQESSALFRTPASVNMRRTPEQLRKASPSIGASNRGNRSLLKPPMSPLSQNKGHSLLKASPATAPKSPFDVISTSDSD